MNRRAIAGLVVAATVVFSAGVFVSQAVAGGVSGTDVQCTRIDYPNSTAELTFGHLADPNVHVTRYIMACIQVDGLPATPGLVPCPDGQLAFKAMGGGIGDGCPGSKPAPDPVVCPAPSDGDSPAVQVPLVPNARAAAPQAPIAELRGAGGGCYQKPIGCDCSPAPCYEALASGDAESNCQIPTPNQGGKG